MRRHEYVGEKDRRRLSVWDALDESELHFLSSRVLLNPIWVPQTGQLLTTVVQLGFGAFAEVLVTIYLVRG